jgi:imidazole glycerol-phosphate synthase subunit HisH
VIAVVDSGGANLASVLHAFARLGEPAELVTDRARLDAADRVVLPGVGAARRAMAALGANGLGDAVRALGKPVLGICLGMQLLFESSAEGDVACLGLLRGRVTRFADRAGLPVPHMGWNQVATAAARPSRVLAGIPSGTHFYFVHSFRADADGDAVCGTTTYGEQFAAVVERDNLVGVQFHPERSGAAGAQLLRNFADLR